MIQYSRNPQDQFKAEDYTIGWSWRLFVFSIIVFAAALLLYIGMSVGYLPLLNKQIADVKKKTADISNAISADDKVKLFNFYSQVFHIQNTLAGHTLPSRLFGFLESNTNKNVSFQSLIFSGDTASLELVGTALSYDDIVGQLESLRRQSAVQSVNLISSKDDSVSLPTQTAGAGKSVAFTIKVTFKKDFLI